MGTTVTTNLGLIKPDVDESIQEDLPTFPGWAVQNGQNCDKIDGLFRNSTPAWSPSWLGGGGNPVLGSGGIVEGKYVRLHPRLVVGWYRIHTGGAGFSPGSGLYQLTLPVAADTTFTGFQDSIPIGKAFLLDADTVASATVLVGMYSVSSGTMFWRKHNGFVWSFNDPFVLAQTDRVTGYFMYPTAAA